MKEKFVASNKPLAAIAINNTVAPTLLKPLGKTLRHHGAR